MKITNDQNALGQPDARYATQCTAAYARYKTIIFATEFTYNLSNKIALYKVKNIIDKENLKNIIKLNRPPRGGVVNRGKSNE